MTNVVSFTSTMDATPEDWAAVEDYAEKHELPTVAQRLFALLEMQRDYDDEGYPVNVYGHCLQTATRALRAGESDAFVTMALFHDCADHLPGNHAEHAANFLKWYLSDDLIWCVRHHVIFQSHFFKDHPTRDPNEHAEYKGHPAYDLCFRFCRDYDAPSFDPNYDTLPVEAFHEIAERALSKRKPVLETA